MTRLRKASERDMEMDGLAKLLLFDLPLPARQHA